jgi:hypothetical protein
MRFGLLSRINAQLMAVPLWIGGILALILVLIPLYVLSKRARLPLPPGPKGWPLIGNLFDIPNTNFATIYTDWAQKYGS